MPTILTPQGWVKVAPAPRKRAVHSDPTAALRGPLAYFSCRPDRSANIPTATGGKGREQFPYDLSASPEKLKRRGQLNAQGKGPHQQHRSVSEPIVLEIDGDAEVEVVDEFGRSTFPLAAPKSKARSKSKLNSHSHHGHRPPSSSASSSTLSSSSSSSVVSGTSYHRHRPVQASHAAPSHHHQPSSPRGPRGEGGHHHHYGSHRPLPPSSMGRSMSYNWYNATTALNL